MNDEKAQQVTPTAESASVSELVFRATQLVVFNMTDHEMECSTSADIAAKVQAKFEELSTETTQPTPAPPSTAEAVVSGCECRIEVKYINDPRTPFFPPQHHVIVRCLHCKTLDALVVELRQQLANELHDVEMLDRHCSHVYDYMTDGLISKANTLPEVVIEVFEDKQTEHYNEWLKDELGGYVDPVGTIERQAEEIRQLKEQYAESQQEIHRWRIAEEGRTDERDVESERADALEKQLKVVVETLERLRECAHSILNDAQVTIYKPWVVQQCDEALSTIKGGSE